MVGEKDWLDVGMGGWRVGYVWGWTDRRMDGMEDWLCAGVDGQTDRIGWDWAEIGGWTDRWMDRKKSTAMDG